jgi:hypothetical protein
LALPENKHDIARAYRLGFLPSSHLPESSAQPFYLARSIRVRVLDARQNKSYRRAERSIGAPIGSSSVFEIGEIRHDASLALDIENFSLAAAKLIAPGKFGAARIAYLLWKSHLTHVIIHRDKEGRIIALGYIAHFDNSWHFWFSFYIARETGLGKLLVLKTIDIATQNGIEQLYLGTCYGTKSLYKAMLNCEFFHEGRWCSDRNLLLSLLARDTGPDSEPNVWNANLDHSEMFI